MKKILLSFIFSIVSLCPLISQVNLSLEPIISTTLGKYNEYVFSPSDKGIVSLLEWQQLPLFKIGGAAQVSAGNLFINTDFFFGLPLKCGKMYDSDWNDYGIKTTYSISNNYAKENYNFSFSAAYKFKYKKIDFCPQISFDFFYDSFQSNDGHGWYGSESYSKTGDDESWDSPYAKHFSKLSRIDLKRTNWYIFSGFIISIPITNLLSFQAGTFTAPFAYTYNSDFHHDDNGTNHDFYLNSCQKMYFKRFKETLCLKYNLNQTIDTNFCINILFGGIQKGLLEGWEQNAGTDLLIFDLRLGLIFSPSYQKSIY